MEQVFHALEPEFKGKISFINIDVYNPAEGELLSQYKIQYIPTIYLLNAKGDVSFNYVGVIKKGEMRAKLQQLAEAK